MNEQERWASRVTTYSALISENAIERRKIEQEIVRLEAVILDIKQQTEEAKQALKVSLTKWTESK